MSVAQSSSPGLRIVYRKRVRSSPAQRTLRLRASWIDPFVRGDVWLVPREDDQLDLMFDHFRVAQIRGTPLDVMSLNQLAFSLRHRLPRQLIRVPLAARARRPAPAR